MRIPTLVAALLALLLSTHEVAAEELFLIVNRESGVSALSREQVSHLFLGRVKVLPTGARATVVEVEPLRASFYRRLLGRDLSEVNAYWARLQFSGRAQPPLRVADSGAAIARVMQDPGAVAFVGADPADPRARGAAPRSLNPSPRAGVLAFGGRAVPATIQYIPQTVAQKWLATLQPELDRTRSRVPPGPP